MIPGGRTTTAAAPRRVAGRPDATGVLTSSVSRCAAPGAVCWSTRYAGCEIADSCTLIPEDRPERPVETVKAFVPLR
ncbi:hypothetical protein ACWEM1_17895 [Streptomyces sp. NPDC004491]